MVAVNMFAINIMIFVVFITIKITIIIVSIIVIIVVVIIIIIILIKFPQTSLQSRIPIICCLKELSLIHI